MKKIALLAAVAAMGFSAATYAAPIGTDNTTASAYSDGWGTGDNGAVTGSGIGAWTLANSGSTGFAGYYTGDSSGVGSNINTGGASFAMYGNSGDSYANATRTFTTALSVGQTASLDIAVNYRNGNKGVDLLDGSGNTLVNFNVGGDDYTLNGSSIGNAYSANTVFHIAYTQTTATGGTVTITRSGGVSDLDTGSYTGVAAGFKLYIGQTDGGGASENNLYSNNFSVVPEPASLALLGLGGLTALRRRRK